MSIHVATFPTHKQAWASLLGDKKNPHGENPLHFRQTIINQQLQLIMDEPS